VTAPTNRQQAAIEGLIEVDLPVGSSDESASALSISARQFFDLTDGESMIRDEEGIMASSLQAATVSALETVEELRALDPLHADEWQGWWPEIVDASGQAVQTIPLDVWTANGVRFIDVFWFEGQAFPEGVFVFYDSLLRDYIDVDDATHWMPPPAPPGEGTHQPLQEPVQ
jgi:hypothetical protein